MWEDLVQVGSDRRRRIESVLLGWSSLAQRTAENDQQKAESGEPAARGVDSRRAISNGVGRCFLLHHVYEKAAKHRTFYAA